MRNHPWHVFRAEGLAQAAIDAADPAWRSPTGRRVEFHPDAERYAGTYRAWLAEKRDSGIPVGQVGLAFQDVEGKRHPEIGWLLDRPHWGQGYATEAGAAIRDAAFNAWGYDHVISLIRPVNYPSQRVAIRIGMTEGRRVQFHGYEHCVFELARPEREKRVERPLPS